MSTPDAVPVEVEGVRQVRLWAEHSRSGAPAPKDYIWTLLDELDRLRALPAAPTTPDIADERVAELRAWLIGRMVAADERTQRAATLLDERRYDEARGQSEAFMQSINALDRALATPSTPGAGQGEPS